MASPAPQWLIIPSLLDRCLEDKTEGAQAQRSSRYQTLQEALTAITRDLEALLNTRQTPGDTSPPDEELHNSILTYGLPDLARFRQDDRRICQAIADAIEYFEPRLEQVHVVPGGRSQGGLTLHIRIEAILRLHSEPVPTWAPPGESVGFAATLSLNPQHLSIGG